MTENKTIAEMTPKDLAIFFHDTYESLASQFGYETRTETRQFDENSSNGRLMIAVCQRVLARLVAESAADQAKTVFSNSNNVLLIQIPKHYSDSDFVEIAKEFNRIQKSNSNPCVLVRGATEQSLVWVCPDHHKEMCDVYMGEIPVFYSGSSEEQSCVICGSVSKTHLAVRSDNFTKDVDIDSKR